MSEVERLRAVVEFLAKPRGRMAAHVHYDEAVQMARAALLAHPVELLALLAEPKVCEMCGGHGEAQWLASCSECGGLGLDPLRNDRACSRCGGSCEVLVIRDDVPCPSCHGSGSVAVDVLDLLVQAGRVEQVGWAKSWDDPDEPRGWSVCSFPDVSRAGFRYHPNHTTPVFAAIPKDGTP